MTVPWRRSRDHYHIWWRSSQIWQDLVKFDGDLTIFGRRSRTRGGDLGLCSWPFILFTSLMKVISVFLPPRYFGIQFNNSPLCRFIFKTTYSDHKGLLRQILFLKSANLCIHEILFLVGPVLKMGVTCCAIWMGLLEEN